MSLRSRAIVVGILAIGAVMFVGLQNLPKGSTDAPSNPAAPVSGVPWRDYASDLKPRIDGLAAAADCAGLQREFDTADANNAATRSRTGHSNTDLMAYIDDAMRGAGCYGN
jgi:hypothetical protein